MSNRLRHLLAKCICKACRHKTLRPQNVYRGTHVLFECTNPSCGASEEVRLPRLCRTVIYLDTSTISHIVRSLSRRDLSSPYHRLYHALKAAAYANVIACVGSSIVRSEGELSIYATEIARMSRELGDAGATHDLHVRDAQVYRAFYRYLRDEPPLAQSRPPRLDAFDEKVDKWPSMLAFRSHMPSHPEWIEARRNAKAKARADVEAAYRRYEQNNLRFSEIVGHELAGFASLLRQDPIFYRLMYIAQQRLGLSHEEASKLVSTFLGSDYVATLPMAVINARLHAALAMLCRGSSARLPKESDLADIDHLATYAPYVNIFVADRFFADLANQRHVRIGSEFDVTIRSLGMSEVDEFIEVLSQLEAACPTAAISRQVYDAIAAGGFVEDLAAMAARYMAGRQS